MNLLKATVPALNNFCYLNNHRLCLPFSIDHRPPDTEYVEMLLEAFGIAEKQHEHPNRLSGGQQQWVAIAKAIAYRPAILLADEPTGNLDSETGRDVMELL